jgi:chromosome segregation ATPase
VTPEEIERTIEFILRHEGEVFARIDRLSATSERHEQAMERHEQAMERHDREISQLTDLLGRLAQAEIHLVERMDALAAAHKETGERLNVLIDTVERYITGRNGDSSQGEKK